jgi:DNA-binding LacI/PurR family transcriptional regulator
LIEAGLPYDPALTCEVEGYPTVALGPLIAMLTRQPSVTAIFAANDQIALAVYQAARQMGRQIPHDLALVGFDDLDFTMHLDVPLTTVAQPAFEIGRRAVQAVVRRINHEVDGWQQEILPTQLIIRRSCGAYLKEAASGE